MKGITKYFPKPCRCGCGELVSVRKYYKKDRGYTYIVNKFIKSHAKRGEDGFNPEIHSPRLCLCGCGSETAKFRGKFNRFIKGHENRNRIAWNKGLTFSVISRKKMSLARLGREPANKIRVDLNDLYRLYVLERNNISIVSQKLGISKDVLKNRLRFLEWSRSTKDSCSHSDFKERMRQIRIKTLSSKPLIESPNKLEKSVYDTLDKFKIYYEKQVPLFNKFVVDVLFPYQNLVLEIFGRYWHDRPNIKKKDFSKRKYLETCGYRVEELWDYDIKEKGVELALREVFRKHNFVNYG